MADEVIKELWQIKDDIAEEHGCDISAFAAHLRSRTRLEGQTVVDLSVGKAISQGSSNKPSQP